MMQRGRSCQAPVLGFTHEIYRLIVATIFHLGLSDNAVRWHFVSGLRLIRTQVKFLLPTTTKLP
jgi:hypothetical protein